MEEIEAKYFNTELIYAFIQNLILRKAVAAQ